MAAVSSETEINPGYLTDASGYTGRAERVFVPSNEADVIEIIRAAREERKPLTVAGAGSGLTGGRVAQGGWVLSLERFGKIDVSEGKARCGAAATLLQIRDAAGPTRQFYAPDPTEITASVGGTVATNASGSRSFRYGSTRRHVLALRMALMSGDVVEYRRGDRIDFPVEAVPLPDTRKCTASYRLQPGMDWIDLFCGSEGTLGIVLEAELSLLPSPAEVFAGVIFFRSDDEALDAVDLWRSVPDLRMLEYADRNSLDLLAGRYPDIPRQAGAALLIEAEGDDVDAWEQRLTSAGALIDDSWFAVTAADRERFRKFRHSLPELVIATVVKRGFLKMGTDYAVPVGHNREMLTYYRNSLEAELPGKYVIYGHIGDAHVHVNMLPATKEEAGRASDLLGEFAGHAVALGGTVSAEHGIGKRKVSLLSLQYSPAQIRAMMDVKWRLDPDWLLGRGTLFAAPPEFA
jgi:FAD/FMN-containing dehydrogenase